MQLPFGLDGILIACLSLLVIKDLRRALVPRLIPLRRWRK